MNTKQIQRMNNGELQASIWGCDETIFPGIVGYQRTVRDGWFTTILIYDEKVFKLLAKAVPCID